MIELQAYAKSALTGGLVRLRPLAPDDVHALAEWWNDPEWMVLQQPSILPRPEAVTAAQFEAWSKNDSPSGLGMAIETLSGTLVGHIVLYGMELPVRCGTLAIIIGPQHVDKGYGSDAIAVALRLAFEELGLNKVELSVYAHNERAVAVYEKLGFQVEGRRRAATFHRGKFWDQLLMGILAADYLP